MHTLFLSAVNGLAKSSRAATANLGIMKLVWNRSMYCGNSSGFFFISRWITLPVAFAGHSAHELDCCFTIMHY